jgi:hypothetical protein
MGDLFGLIAALERREVSLILSDGRVVQAERDGDGPTYRWVADADVTVLAYKDYVPHWWTRTIDARRQFLPLVLPKDDPVTVTFPDPVTF